MKQARVNINTDGAATMVAAPKIHYFPEVGLNRNLVDPVYTTQSISL